MRKLTSLIKRLLKRKYVWYSPRERSKRSQWRRVVRKTIVGDHLLILAKTTHDKPEYVIFSYLLCWDSPKCIPSDSWVGMSRKRVLREFDRRCREIKKNEQRNNSPDPGKRKSRKSLPTSN